MDNKVISEILDLEFTYEEMIKELTLTNQERGLALLKYKPYNQIGYAIQLLIMRSKGVSIPNIKEYISKDIIEYVCYQLDIPNDTDISKYSRSNRLRDRKEIIELLGYTEFKESKEIEYKLFNIAMSTSSKDEMLKYFIDYLRNTKILLPAISTLNKLVDRSIRDTNSYIYKRISNQVKDKEKLKLFVSTLDSRLSSFNTVKNNKVHRRNDLVEHINLVNEYCQNINLGYLHISKRLSLYKKVEELDRANLIRLKDKDKQMAYIALFIEKYKQDKIDELIVRDRQKYNKDNRVIVNKSNIKKYYKQFRNKVVIAPTDIDYVELFARYVLEKSNYYKSSDKNYYINIRDIEVQVDELEHEKLVSAIVTGDYTSKEREEVISNIDVLVNKHERQAKGCYYTSKELVDKSHQMLIMELGHDWYNEYTVYDCAAGTNNLTRDYTFKNLITSTLDSRELNISRGYNTESEKFQYDFLKIVENDLPQNIIDKLIKNEKMLFLINPPYKKLKTNDTQTDMGYEMESLNLSSASKQLTTQFLYRILKMKKLYNLTNVHVALFSDLNYMKRPTFKIFRDMWLEEFSYKSGMLFDSESFEGVANTWLISFALWGNKNHDVDKNTFKHEKIVKNKDANKYKCIYKDTYNTDNKRKFKVWVDENIKNSNDPVVYLFNTGTDCVNDSYKCKLSTESIAKWIGVSKEDLSKAIMVYIVRDVLRPILRGIYKNNIIKMDFLMYPNDTHFMFKAFIIDTLVYLLMKHDEISYKGDMGVILDNIDIEEILSYPMINKETKELLKRYMGIDINNQNKKLNVDEYIQRLTSRIKAYSFVIGLIG